MRNKIRKIRVMRIFSIMLLLMSVLSLQASAATSQVVSRVNTASKVIALTFDDGDDGANDLAVLQILSQNNIKATFFFTGQAAESHPDILKQIVANGHEIGNHSYSHPYFTQLSSTQMKDQVNWAETSINSITGKSTKPYFRPPYGDYNSTVLQAVGEAGYTKTITWTIDTLDWTGNSAATITQRVVNNACPGAIVLMHTGSGAVNTKYALQNMITSLKSMGYSFVTMSQLLTYSTTSGGTQYVVKYGDTLYMIAKAYGVTVQQIVNANNISNPDLIYVNQVLIIPVGTTTPAPNPTPTPTPTPSATTYVVKAGDTLYAIARAYGVTIQQIVDANGISNPNLIYVNQVLRIPAGTTTTTPSPTPSATTYVVKAGDTLYAIASAYGVTIQQLVSANNIANPDLIYVNQVLIIPG
ncbi:MAG: LysM peptidoglycan-binding domain-containing protein [Clostridiaceae bacterium]